MLEYTKASNEEKLLAIRQAGANYSLRLLLRFVLTIIFLIWLSATFIPQVQEIFRIIYIYPLQIAPATTTTSATR